MHSPLCVLVLTVSAAAQLPFVSPTTANGVEGSTNNGFPFTSATRRRYQQIHADLPASPLLISRLGFRADTPPVVTTYLGTRTIVIDMTIGTGPASHADVSRTFAANFATSTQVLANQTLNWGPQGTTAAPPGPQPFSGVNTEIMFPAYLWPGSTLTWEVAIHSNAPAGGFGVIDAEQGSFTSAPATLTGTGCLCTARTVTSTIMWVMADVNGYLNLQIGVNDGPSLAPVLVAIGTASANLPYPGLCSNILTDLAVAPFAIGSTDVFGTLPSQQGLTVSVANAFTGATLHFQNHMLDIGQAGLPVCNSSGVALTVPAPNLVKVVRVSRMFDNSNTTTAATGVFFATSSIAYGLPVEFN